ncbi:MAG: LuxR C-terminal-related transcriptional regulator [Oscillospiraceae bacterium]|nr:LuxR C-terminal-related transcriptional regulator [Oscillospiraceae bacterium]
MLTDKKTTEPRTKLMELLDGISEKRFVYIHAPAGFGKTFSVRLWLERRSEASAWVALSKAATYSSYYFYKKCAVALSSLQPGNEELKDLITHKSFNAAPYEFMEHILYSFNSYARGKGENYIYVIDDLHFVENANLLNHFSEHIRDLSEQMTVFIISRTEPPVSFSEYILKENLTVVNVEHLKFSETEIKSLFTSRGRKLTFSQIQDIEFATGGWAIGLNALLLSESSQVVPKQLSQYLKTFIKEQIWEKWDKKRKDFILRISVVEDFTPEFCKGVTGRKDSAEILDEMVRENAFISADNNTYRFHHLFQDFLLDMLVQEQHFKDFYQTAGDWLYKHGDCYKAVECYIKCSNNKGIAKGLSLMYNYNSPYASIEDTVSIIRQSVDQSVTNEYPFLLETLAWSAFVEGRHSEMKSYLKKYFKQLPKVILQNPASAYTSVLMRVVDSSDIVEVAKSLKKLPLKFFSKANTPSVTQNLPFFHRASIDLSDMLLDEKNNFSLFNKTIGVLFGEELSVIENTIRAGFAYERGNLDEAYDFAITANTTFKKSHSAEVKFCALMILASIMDAQRHSEDVVRILNNVEKMIENERAYYLDVNYRAFLCRIKLNNGEKEAARSWLKNHSISIINDLQFYKLFQYFTTTRAFITLADNNTAILLLEKMLIMCEEYCRPLDIIEIKVLQSISLWKKGGSSREKALDTMEQAIALSLKYRFTQVFVNEGAEITNILHRFQKRTQQKDYKGNIPPAYVKTLYIHAMTRAKSFKGLTGGQAAKEVSFTERQKEVMRYLCEGLTQKEIGMKMNLKASSIKSHMILIYNKLDVANGVDAVIKINEMKLLEN